MMTRPSVIVTSCGALGLGAVGVSGLQHAFSSELFGVAVTDPAVLVGVSGLLAAVAETACEVPDLAREPNRSARGFA